MKKSTTKLLFGVALGAVVGYVGRPHLEPHLKNLQAKFQGETKPAALPTPPSAPTAPVLPSGGSPSDNIPADYAV